MTFDEGKEPAYLVEPVEAWKVKNEAGMIVAIVTETGCAPTTLHCEKCDMVGTRRYAAWYCPHIRAVSGYLCQPPVPEVTPAADRGDRVKRQAAEISRLRSQLGECSTRHDACCETNEKLFKRVGRRTGRVLQLESLLREKGIEVPA